jgi:hypothetical protein
MSTVRIADATEKECIEKADGEPESDRRRSNGLSFRSTFLRLAASPLKSIAKKIYYEFFRLQLRVRFWCADRIRTPLSGTPIPPAKLRFRVSESISVGEFLRIGAGCANLIRQHVNDMGVEFANMGRVLDFGCGCGRTSRWFLQDGGTAEFHGVDVDEEARLV